MRKDLAVYGYRNDGSINVKMISTQESDECYYTISPTKALFISLR